MALTIDEATVGYDIDGINDLLNQIKADVIEDAKNKLQESESTLIDSIDAIWQGKSAETFKSNMHADILVVCDALDKSYATLHTEVYKAGYAMGHVDEELVQGY